MTRQFSCRIPEDVYESLESGRIARRFSTLTAYITALILRDVGRTSGLDGTLAQSAVMTDARVGGAVTDAISAIEAGDNPKAIASLRFAQDVILDGITRNGQSVVDTAAERLRIVGGDDDWARAEAGKRP